MEERIMYQGTDVTEVFDYYNNQEEHKKHLKGYIYDSLVYRYQLARYKASLKARFNYDRDLMRFCEILNEAIGEHD